MEQEQYGQLRRRIIFAAVTVALVPLLLSNALIYYYYNFEYTKEILDHASELVERHRQAVDSFLGQHARMVRIMADTMDVSQLTSGDRLERRLEELKKHFAVVDLGIVDDKGVQVAYAGPLRLTGAEYGQSEWFRKALSEDHYISDVFTGLRGAPHFIVTARKVEGGKVWIYRATVDFAAFTDVVGGLKVGKTGRAFIIDREGVFQTARRPGDKIDPALLADLTGRGNAGRPVVLEPGERTSRDFIYVAAGLKDSDWILVFEQRRDDAFAHFYQARAISVTILALGGLGIILMAVFLTRRGIARLADADRERQIMHTQVLEAGKLAAIGELAAGIAHEINNPVAIMIEEAGWIGDLTGEGENASANLEEIRTAVRNIVTQGRRCRDITHKLLSFARRTDSPSGDTDMNALIEELAGLTAQRTKLSNINLRLELSPDFPNLEFSPSEMQQVILNLVNNAIDAIGEARGGEIAIRSFVQDGRAVIEVADNGQGIPPAVLGRIFEPFFTTKPEGKGTGLGLPICRGIVRKMGGDLLVDSREGQGTTFRVDLPAPPQPKPEIELPDQGPID